MHDETPTGDTFDRLLARRGEIAEFVNSFASERVQRKAFAAIVCSLGLAADDTADPVLAEPLRLVREEPGAEADQEGTEESVTADSGAASRRRRGRSASKKTFTVPRGLNFAPEGHPTLEQFVAEKQPRNMDEKVLVACYYLSNMMGVADVEIGQILAVFQAAEWNAPAHPDNSVRAAASRTGWIDTANTKSIKVVWKGENYVTTKMPADSKKKSG
ncbi:hypothetical protein [Kribbella swartbergensis]